MRKAALIAVLFIVVAGAFAVWLRREVVRPYGGFSSPQIFVEIPHGTSRWSIASLLQRNGVIHSRLAFLLVSERHHKQALQAGEYLFNRPQTPVQVFDEIASGRIYVHTVVIPEGWTMFDIAAELERQRLCTKREFLAVAEDPSLIRKIAPKAESLEGFLFPSTYQFTRNTSPEEMAATMVHQFVQEWKKLELNSAANPASERPVAAVTRGRGPDVTAHHLILPASLSPIQIVTLASLIERETPQPKERSIIASVFYNRLSIGLPLQCDPTVQYALDLEGKPVPKISAADLGTPSPYNTYLHRGLPPGPIANPGDASLFAALNPARTHYLYFVANDAGGHFFSSTLAQQDRNVEKYRRLLEGLPADPPVVRRRREIAQPRRVRRRRVLSPHGKKRPVKKKTAGRRRS